MIRAALAQTASLAPAPSGVATQPPAAPRPAALVRLDLITERDDLIAAQQAAPSWGAAVSARHERLREIEAELARLGEHKFTGPDGAIWPITRAGMRDPVAIVERMVEDTLDLARAHGEPYAVLSRDLVNLGWPGEQVFRRTPAVRERLGKLDAALKTGAELACLCLFVAAVFIWSAVLGGGA